MQNRMRLALRSVTYAEKARDLLRVNGISSYIVRLRPAESPGGCAFGLEVPSQNMQAASALLTKAAIGYTVLQNGERNGF